MTAGTIAFLLFIVFPIGVVVLRILIYRSSSAAFRVFNRNVLRRESHQDGDYIVKNPLVFKTGADFGQLRSRIVSDITQIRSQQSNFRPDLYLFQAGDKPDGEFVADFRFGAKGGIKIIVKMRQDGGVIVGSVDVVKWHITNGVIIRVDIMKFVRERVEQIVLSLDPRAELSSRSGLQSPQAAPSPQFYHPGPPTGGPASQPRSWGPPWPPTPNRRQ